MYESVAQDIVRDIVGRELPPGTRLEPEEDMLERYSVSRGSLREALRILEFHGLIAIRPGSGGGAFVGHADGINLARSVALFLHMSGTTYRELVVARATLEPAIAATSAANPSPDLLVKLRGSISQTRDALERGDTDLYARSTWDFHAALATASANPVVQLIGLCVETISEGFLAGLTFEASDTVLARHDEIVEAIEGREVEAVSSLMRRHLAEVLAAFEQKHADVLDGVVSWS